MSFQAYLDNIKAKTVGRARCTASTPELWFRSGRTIG